MGIIIYTYEADIVTTQIYSMINIVVITLDDGFKAYEADVITLSYFFMIHNHCQSYNLKDIVFGNMLRESWLKVLRLYEEVLFERSKLIFGQIVTIREVLMAFSVGVKLVKNSFTQVNQQGAQKCFVYMDKLNNNVEVAAALNFHMAVEVQQVDI